MNQNDTEPSSVTWRLGGEFKYLSVLGGGFETKEMFEDIKKFKIYEDDCFIVSYPKSGTTLTQETVYLIYNQADGQKSQAAPLFERVPFLDWSPGMKRVSELQRPRLIKSHLPFFLLPEQAAEKRVKLIYIMRNPKDALSSYYNFYKSGTSFRYKGTWNQFFDMFLEKRLFCGDYYDHVLGWWESRDKANILFLKYEEMITSPKANIEKISKFVGIDLTPDMIDSIAQQTTFEHMKNNPMTNFSTCDYQDNGVTPFMRKGKIGDWINYFTEEQCRIIEKIHSDRLEGSGLDMKVNY